MTATIIITLALFSFYSLLIRSLWYSFLMLFSLLTLFYLISLGISPEGVEFSFFLVDPLSMSLNYLTLWIISLMLLSSAKVHKYSAQPILFVFMLLCLLLSLLAAFFSKGALSFYFFFEFSLIPTIFLVVGWGYQVERIQAAIYFLIYTMVASLPLLIFIFFVSSSIGGLDFFQAVFLGPMPFSFNTFPSKIIVLWSATGAFLVKFPMYLFHLWLPKAHVEAPVSGSMILAGVLLKLGGFGIIRMSYLCLSLLSSYSFLLMSLSLVSISCVSIICLRSNDLKSLVAYSSVSHMAMSMAGLFCLFYFGVVGASLMLLGHGVCSSGLFSYINMIYERSSSRSLSVNKGLCQFSVSAGLFMFLLSIINMAAPPTMNLFSELFIMASILSYSFVSVFLLIPGALLVASYCMTLFSLSHHGVHYTLTGASLGLIECEFLVLTNHIIPLLFSFIAINLIL